jgi:hypothetical protein
MGVCSSLTGVSSRTLVDFYNMLREVCTMQFYDFPDELRIGGPA